ncbi:UNVERIFIED_CONTAM: arhgap45 [Trichonephila clavipes]
MGCVKLNYPRDPLVSVMMGYGVLSFAMHLLYFPNKTETMRVAAHERLGEVLRILRSILEKYPPIQSTELLMTAGTLIQQVKGYNYEDEKSDPSNFFDAIDQLALAFSSSVR